MLGPARTIGKAIFKDIEELPPASFLVYKNGRLNIKPYWQLTASEFSQSESEAIEYTHFLVKDSIERQLVSDVPLCAFLSGGLDSSIILKTAADKYAETGKVFDTYSVDYTDNDIYFKKAFSSPTRIPITSKLSAIISVQTTTALCLTTHSLPTH
ncbi:MAG: asparagine synthase-related protein [Clostridiales bacterium]|nr:asparagine synthase-related protein [Clostridiales bacterium]